MSKRMMVSWVATSAVVLGCSSGDAPREAEESAPIEVPSEAIDQAPAAEAPREAPPSEAPAAVQSHVDLLHALPTTVRVSTALANSPQQIARLVDGDLTTAWNSQTEDLVGAYIEVGLPPDAQVTSIEMTSGFTHQRPSRDLFQGNHRVARVRVMHDGIEVGTYPLSTSDQALQVLPVAGSGGVYRLEVLEVIPGDQPTWRETCVSELRVLGSAPSDVIGTRTPTLAIASDSERRGIREAILASTLGAPDAGPEDDTGASVEEIPLDEGFDEGDGMFPGDQDEGDEAMDESVVEDVASGSRLVPREGLRLTELTVAAGVERREAVDPRTTFSKATDERVYCMLRLANPERIPTSITVRFEPIDHPERGRDSELQVPGGPTYTTFTYNGTRGRAGLYRCVVRDAVGALLGSAAWQLTE